MSFSQLSWHEKKQQRDFFLFAVFSLHVHAEEQNAPRCCRTSITCRGSRQKRLVFCGHERDGMPIHDGRSLLPFSRGNHAC